MKDWTTEGMSKEWIRKANDEKITRVLSKKDTKKKDTVEQRIQKYWEDSGYEKSDDNTTVLRKSKIKQ